MIVQKLIDELLKIDPADRDKMIDTEQTYEWSMKNLLLLLFLAGSCLASIPTTQDGLPFTSEYFTLDIWTQTGPEYFGGLPEAAGVPTNYVDGPGSVIIPYEPSEPPSPPPVPLLPPSIVVVVTTPPSTPVEPPLESQTPEPGTLMMLAVGLGILVVWRLVKLIER